MKLDKKTLVTAITFLLIGIIGTSIVWVYATPASIFYISEGVYPNGFMTVWDDGGIYKAKNAYGQIMPYSDSNASQVINDAITTIGNYPSGKLVLKGQIYLTHGIGINTIDQSIFTLDLRDARINARTYGTPIIDLTGSHDGVRILGGWIYGFETGAPNVGLLMARNTSSSSAGQHIIEGTIFEGYYTKSAIYMYGSEENNFVNIYARNRQNSAKTVYITSDNPESVTSSFTTIATGDQSMTHINFYGGHIFALGTTSIAVLFRSSTTYLFNGIQFYGTMIGATSTALYFDISNSNMSNIHLRDVRITDTEPAYALYAPDSASAREISKLSINGGIIQPTVKDVHLGSNVIAKEWVIDQSVEFFGNKGITFTTTPDNNIIYHPSYLTQNSGSESLATGATVSHGLAETPTTVLLTISVSEDIWATALGASTFTVNFDGGGTQTVYWFAEYKP